MNLTVPKTSAIVMSILSMLCLGVTAAAAADRYVVVFKTEASLPTDAGDRVRRAGGRPTRVLPAIGTIVASGDAVFAELMARDRDVLAVGIERLRRRPPSVAIPFDPARTSAPEAAPTPADNLYFFQWNMRRIGAPAVWSRFPLSTGGRRPIVALLDSGVADDHPDLAGQVVATNATSYCNTPGGSANTPSYPKYSSYVDLVANPDWSPADGCSPLPSPTFDFHGTHVGGTIAARFDGGRVVGVAPESGIAAYKVFDVIRIDDPDAGPTFVIGAFDGPVFAAIIHAATAGYPVINMSLGGLLDRSIEEDNATWQAWNRVAKFATKQGTLIVASAGNQATNLNGPIAHIPSDLPSVVSTSATGWSQLQLGSSGLVEPAPGSHDVLAFYSNFGSPVDIAAPGGDCGPVAEPDCLVEYLVLSSSINPAGALGYAFAAGTSMAAPHVSAVAAMVRALHPNWSVAKTRSHLQSTAQNLRPRRHFGHGILDADRAVR
jgi:subtilisin family serine protease